MKETTNLLDLIEDTNNKVKALETEAIKFLEQGNTQGHLERMQQKAQLLAGLSASAQPYLQTLPKDVRQPAKDRIEAFSQSASKALEIGSVFFMSALLYPDEHKPGEPNNLELFIKKLKAQI